jgi:hypothetical protein
MSFSLSKLDLQNGENEMTAALLNNGVAGQCRKIEAAAMLMHLAAKMSGDKEAKKLASVIVSAINTFLGRRNG